MCVCSLALHFSAGSSWKSWRPLSCMKFARSLMVLTRRVIFFPVQSYLMCKGRVKYAELALRACRGCQASLMCSHIFLSGRCKRICYLLQRQVTMCSSHVEKDIRVCLYRNNCIMFLIHFSHSWNDTKFALLDSSAIRRDLAFQSLCLFNIWELSSVNSCLLILRGGSFCSLSLPR